MVKTGGNPKVVFVPAEYVLPVLNDSSQFDFVCGRGHGQNAIQWVLAKLIFPCIWDI